MESGSMEITKRLRFNFMAKNLDEVLEYYHNRAIQLLSQGWSWNGNYINYGWGVQVSFSKDGTNYDSIFILKKGQGYLTRWFKEKERNFFITTDCESMYNWLVNKNIKFTLATKNSSMAYRQISAFYKNKFAKRSNVFYMNHIDEGLYILNKLNSSKIVKDIYCLHPIYQFDLDLKSNWGNSIYEIENSNTALLVMEYRNIANSYLLKNELKDVNLIKLSPIDEVNQALIADKIQNRKDFEKYHIKTHPKSDIIKLYFQNWFERLKISDEFYNECVTEINQKTGNTFK